MYKSAIGASLMTLGTAGDAYHSHTGPINYTTRPYIEQGEHAYGTQALREYHRRAAFESNLNEYILNPKHTDHHLIKTVIPEYQPSFSQRAKARLQREKEVEALVAKQKAEIKPH